MFAIARLITAVPGPASGHAFLAATGCPVGATDICTQLQNSFVEPLVTYAQYLLPVAIMFFFLHRLLNETGQSWRSVLIEIVLVAGGSEVVLQVIKAVFGL
jgi:hypothetical protein